MKYLKRIYNYLKYAKDSDKNEVLTPLDCWDIASRSFKSDKRTSSKMNLSRDAIKLQIRNNKKYPKSPNEDYPQMLR